MSNAYVCSELNTPVADTLFKAVTRRAPFALFRSWKKTDGKRAKGSVTTLLARDIFPQKGVRTKRGQEGMALT